MKVALCILCVFAMASAESWVAAPYTLVKRGNVKIVATNVTQTMFVSAASPEPLPEPQRYRNNRRGSSSRRGGSTSTRYFLALTGTQGAIGYYVNTLILRLEILKK